MSHPFGDLLTHYRARKHGLSQTRLAEAVGYDHAVIVRMCQGKKDLTGPSGRERVVRIIGALREFGALSTLDEANALLGAANLPPLYAGQSIEAKLIPALHPSAPSSEGARVSSLPHPPTPLIGRADDVAAAKKYLMQSDVRLLTLIGPPGVGKTRLAVQVASELSSAFASDVCFVPLAPVGDASFVIPAIAQSLSVIQVGSQPLIESVKRVLQNRHMLLVLDNFEHVLEAATVIAELLACAPRLKALVTSRAALRISGEHEFNVQPLALQPAIELFAHRAHAVKPEFALTETLASTVAAICHRLDGLPLAIELAAARLKLFNPEVLLARLEKTPLELLTNGASDLPAHQRMLRSTIDWSYRLLSDDEQAVFRRLGVFAGGFTLASAEAVADARWPVLSSLLDKSLIKPDGEMNSEPRFTLLELLREYALEKLAECGEMDEARRRHAEYFVALTEAAEPKLLTGEQVVWLTRLNSEHDNLRAALQWAQERGTFETTMRIIGPTWRYWQTRTLPAEGRAWIMPALQDDPAIPAAVRAKAFHAAGALAMCTSDPQAAKVLHERGLVLAEEANDSHTLGLTLNGATAANQVVGDVERAKSLSERSLAHTAGSKTYERAGALVFRSWGLYEERDYVRGLALASEGRDILHELGDSIWEMNMLDKMFEHAFKLGDFTRARRSAVDALHIARQLGPRFVEIGEVCSHLVYLSLCEGQSRHSLRLAHLCAAAEGGMLVLGLVMNLRVMPKTDLASMLKEYAAMTGETPDEQAFATAWAEGRAMTLEQAIEYALSDSADVKRING